MQARALSLTAAVALLSALPLALAHGDDHDMDMGDMAEHGSMDDGPAEGWPMSYFSYSEHVSLLWTYVALTVITWLLVAPPGAQLDHFIHQLIAQTRLTLTQL